MVIGYESTPAPVTLVYKTVVALNLTSEDVQSEVPLHLDVYLPDLHPDLSSTSRDGSVGVPAVVYFHGGGLLVGDRKSWFPEWMRGRLSAQGVALLSADYRLLAPCTGHEILEDIQDLFSYIRKDLNSALAGATGNAEPNINIDAVGVAGTSSGGLCAYLCAIHLWPKPRALLSMYGQGGECLNDNYLEPKTEAFLPGKPLVTPSEFAEFIFPQSTSLPTTAESPLVYYPATHPTPGLPGTKRMYLTRLYYQLGEWVDYYTGDHTLSARLRQLRSSSSPQAESPSLDLVKAREVIGERYIGLFPQFGVAETWPPTFIVHGSEDKQVPLSESKHIAESLGKVGVERELVVVEGQGHSFDYAPGAEGLFAGLFDQATAFLVRNLRA